MNAGFYLISVMEEKKEIKGFKGFDKNLQCRGFQYEVGKEYHTEKAISCVVGFHFCESPFEVFRYYAPSDRVGINRYCEVKGSGDFDVQGRSKVCCTDIKIEKEISLIELIEKGITLLAAKDDTIAAIKNENRSLSRDTEECSVSVNTGVCSAAVNRGDCSIAASTGLQSVTRNKGVYSIAATTGNRSAATNTGDLSAAINTGDYSAATNTGNYSAATNIGNFSVAENHGALSIAANAGMGSTAKCAGKYSAAINIGDDSSAIVEGKESVAIVTGKNSKAKGSLGSWIVLTERDESDGECCPIKDIKAFKVDGEQIKPDTYYELTNGEVVVSPRYE